MAGHEQEPLLSSYLDGELSGIEFANVHAHLLECSDCRQELNALRQVKNWARAAPRRASAPEILVELSARLSPASQPFPWVSLKRWTPAATFAAALTLAVWAGLRGVSEDDYLPLEPLLAAHSRYSQENLVQEDLVAYNFSAQLAAYHGD